MIGLGIVGYGHIGTQLGLYEALDRHGPLTPGELAERVLRPLGMAASEFRATNARGDAWAAGYDVRRGQVAPAEASKRRAHASCWPRWRSCSA